VIWSCGDTLSLSVATPFGVSDLVQVAVRCILMPCVDTPLGVSMLVRDDVSLDRRRTELSRQTYSAEVNPPSTCLQRSRRSLGGGGCSSAWTSPWANSPSARTTPSLRLRTVVGIVNGLPRRSSRESQLDRARAPDSLNSIARRTEEVRRLHGVRRSREGGRTASAQMIRAKCEVSSRAMTVLTPR
jgi:hypothetical protein